MNIESIHFHDSLILEESQAESIIMDIDYPVDWEANKFERHRLTFKDSQDYQIMEGPFSGPVTILDVTVIGSSTQGTRLRIDTNAGYRELTCRDVILTPNGNTEPCH
jgi:hypothetical protein